MLRFVTWLLALLRREHFEITRAGADKYLTRWTLWGKRGDNYHSKLFLHYFHRGDAENYCHDHPWAFWSLILWGGYYEVTPNGRQWYGLGSFLKRPAEWQHRVEIPEGRHAWTIVWAGPKTRLWGFICPGKGWMYWQDHEFNIENGLPGCGE